MSCSRGCSGLSAGRRGSCGVADVHQFHYTARPGDAVTNHALWIRDTLRDLGHQSELYAVDARGTDGVRDLSELTRADALLIHHSQENPALGKLIALPAARKALMYHNITPEKWLRHDAYLAELSARGRQQLALLSGIVDIAFTVSHYNATDLVGFRDVRLLPLVDLSGTAPAPAKREGRSLLFVGRVTPHKGQALLIKALHYLDDYTLSLVGGADPIYGTYLRLLARALGLEDRVRFVGKASDAELAREYASASAFVCVSRHEGFCLPLVEAMRYRLPVFTLPVAAVEETMSGSGVTLPGRKPRRIAETIAMILEDERAVGTVLSGQAERVRALQREQNRPALKHALGAWIGDDGARIPAGARTVRSKSGKRRPAEDSSPPLS